MDSLILRLGARKVSGFDGCRFSKLGRLVQLDGRIGLHTT